MVPPEFANCDRSREAARALTDLPLVEKPDPNHIIPSVLDKRLVKTIAKVIA